MTPATKKALLASIDHWRELEKAKTADDIKLGRSHCALCARFGWNCTRKTPKTSERCPVFKKTGESSCGESPFVDASCAAGDAEFWGRPEYFRLFRSAATREREFLESLLPEAKGKAKATP